jgi:FixJ family two-component response regulator
LAEDDDGIRMAIERFLSFEGYEVCAVRDGEQLLSELASRIIRNEATTSVDVLVTDACMPGYSGLTIVEALRDEGWMKPVVVISAFGDRVMAQRIEKLGGDVVFLQKPFEPDELARAIGQLLPN